MDCDGFIIARSNYHGVAIYSEAKNAAPATVINSRGAAGVAEKNGNQKL